MSFVVLIPARYASTRLPGKVLLEIGGRPMIEWVHRQARASGARRVVIATDDVRIARTAERFGAEACMTAPQHRTGTERIAEVAERLRLTPETVVVNLQADEPLMPPGLIRQVAENLVANADCQVATLCEPIERRDVLFDPNAVKVVMDRRGRALYFSRATIPWYQQAFAAPVDVRNPQPLHYRHVGIYAYHAGYLRDYVRLPASELERAESLEQLRVLHAGGRIHVGVAGQSPGPGVDTETDLVRARELVARPGPERRR